MIVTLKKMRIDPADRGQGARQRIADEAIAARAGTERFVQLGRTVMVVRQRQAPGLPGGIKFPADLGAVQMAHEGFVRIQGHALAVAAAGRLAADGIQAVGPGGARHRTVAAVANAELLRQEIVHGQVGTIVVAHYQADVGVARMRLRIIADKAAIIVLQLLRHRHARMRRVLLRAKGRAPQMMHGVAHARMHVGMTGLQAVDVGAPAFQAQVAEHVIERSVFHHQHDDMVDARQVSQAMHIKSTLTSCGSNHRNSPAAHTVAATLVRPGQASMVQLLLPGLDAQQLNTARGSGSP
ncbi:hypothetical protein D3C72_1280060 [compost metagenome]